MIRKSIKELCKDFTKIENYEEAVNDKNELWTCHHRMEEVFSCKESNERRSNTTKITKQKMSLAYRQYKTNGGTLTWNAWGKNVWRGIEVREETK